MENHTMKYFVIHNMGGKEHKEVITALGRKLEKGFSAWFGERIRGGEIGVLKGADRY